MSTSRPHWLRHIVTWCTLAGSLGLQPQVSANDPVDSRELLPDGFGSARAVDDQKTTDWPAGPWQAVPRSEFFQLIGELDRARKRPRSAWIRHAVYLATVRDNRLSNGELRFEVVNTRPTPSQLTLSPLHLEISSLKTGNVEANWGTTPAGSIVLVVPPGTSQVSGTWSLPGRRLAHHKRFPLRLAPSVRSTLLLDLDGGLKPSTPDGHVTPRLSSSITMGFRPTPEPHRRWQVMLGQETTCRLLVSPQPDVAVREPSRLLVRQHTSGQVSISGVRTVTDFAFESSGTPRRELLLSAPTAARVSSVLYDGQPVSVNAVAAPGAGTPGNNPTKTLWRVTLPDALPLAEAGASRTLRVILDTDLVTDRPWPFPEITVEDSQLIAGDSRHADPDLVLSVTEPLEIKTFRATGWKQTGDSVGGRQFTFKRISSATSLEWVIGRSRTSLQADTLARLDRNQAGWTVSAEIVWTAISGAAFTTRARLASGWNVVDLKPVDAGTRVAWRTVAVPGNRQELIIDWSDAVDATARRPLVIQIARIGIDLEASELPLIRPLDVDRHRLILASAVSLDGTSLGNELGREQDGVLLPVLPELLGDPWPSFSGFDAVTESADGGLFRWTPAQIMPGHDPTQPLTKRPSRAAQPVAAPTLISSSLDPSTDPGSSSTPDDSSPPDVESLAGSGRAVTMMVTSRLAAMDADLDHHSAIVAFAGGSYGRPFRFELSNSARLEAVLVNGQEAATTTDQHITTVPPLEDGLLRSIEIRYAVPSVSAFLVSSKTTPVPQVDEEISMTWTVIVPPDQVITSSPGEWLSQRRPQEDHWTVRWLGPLGRGAHRGMFNPLSLLDWQRLGSGDLSRDGETSHWCRRQHTFRKIPESVPVTVVRHDRLLAVSWLLVILVLFAGISCHRFDRRPATRHTAALLAGIALTAWWTPSPWTLLTGAVCAATLLLLVLPSHLWRQRLASHKAGRPGFETSIDDRSLGSTRTFRGASAGLFLLWLWLGSGIGPALTAQDARREAVATTRAEQSSPGPDVLVPIDAGGRPSARVPFAFVRPVVLERWQHELKSLTSEAGALIRRVRYKAQVSMGQPTTLEARFDVVVTRMAKDNQVAPARVVLPLDGVNLGPESCQVNGQRHPLVRHQQARQVSLSLPPSTGDEPRVDQVTLTLRPTLSATANGGQIDVQLPVVLDGELEWILDPVNAMAPRVSVTGAVPLDHPNAPQGVRHYRLTGANRLQLNWSTGPTLAASPTRSQLVVEPMCVVEVHPLESQLDYRLRFTRPDQAIDHLTLVMPGSLQVRSADITSEGLQRVSPLPRTAEHTRPFLLEWDSLPEKHFEVRIRARLPVMSMDHKLGIAPLVACAHSTPPVSAKTLPLRVGLVPAPGFQLNVAPVSADQATAIDPLEFTRDWQADPTVEQPITVSTWSLQDDVLNRPQLESELRPLVPRRVLRVEQILHVGEKQVAINVAAAARVTGSSVFHHEVQVDPRLTITSVTIRQQDGAERLARKARVGDRLILFLKGANLSSDDSNDDIQTIAITGHMPVTATEMGLPALAFGDAEITENILVLYHDPRLTVTVSGTTPVTTGNETPVPVGSSNESQDVLAGRFHIPDALSTASLKIAHKALPSPMQVVYRLNTDDSEGPDLQAFMRSTSATATLGPLAVTLDPVLMGVNTATHPANWLPQPDSQESAGGRLTSRFQAVSSVTLALTLPQAPETGRWHPPLPRLSNRVVSASFLVITNTSQWRPSGDVSRMSSWPAAWNPQDLRVDDSTTMWRIDGPNWYLERETRVPSTSPSTKPTANPAPPAGGTGPRAPRPLVHNSSPWSVAWQILLSCGLAAAIAWGYPAIQQSRLKAWMRRTDPVAWLVIGMAWWLAGMAGAAGFLLTLATAGWIARTLSQKRPHPPVPSTDPAG